MSKKAKSVFIVLLAVILMLTVGIVGTLAYLFAKDSVENTFTIGNIALTLDETKVDTAGVAVTPAARVKGNTYKLNPGHTYKKDPVVHVAANSENAWVFIKVTNGIASVEDPADTIDSQIKTNGWTALASVPGVYYCQYTTNAQIKDIKTFDHFKVATTAKIADLEAVKNAKLSVVAYAIQTENLQNASDAWTAVSAN